MLGVVVVGRRAIAQGILSTMTSATAIPAALLCRKAFTGKASAGGASTITLAANTVYGTNLEGYLDGCTVEILEGTGAGQTGTIASYVASTRVATMKVAWVTQPDNTSVYRVRHALDDVQASQALVRCETAAALVCVDGATPTVAAGTNVGIEMADNDTWQIDTATNLRNFKAINAAAGNGAVLKIITFA